MYKKLVRDSSIYVLGELVNKAIPFLLLPVLTRFLTPEDYGVLAIFSILVSVLIVLVGLNAQGAVNVNFFKMPREEFRVFIGNVFLIVLGSTFILMIITLIFGGRLSAWITIPRDWIFVAVIIAFGQFVTTVNLILWMAERRPKAYTLYQFSQSLLFASLTLVFIIGIGMQWEGQALARAITVVLFAFVSAGFIFHRSYVRISLNIKHIKKILRFGGPLVPHALAGWARNGVDRLILVALVGTAATGIYSVGYQVGLIIGILVEAVNKAWSPYLYRTLNANPDVQQKKRLVYISYAYAGGLLLLALFLGGMAPWVMEIVVGASFRQASDYVVWIALAYAFQGMNYLAAGYLFYQEQTVVLAKINIVVALLHSVLCFLLIEHYGAMGAAYSSTISFFLSFIWTWYASNQSYAMPWNLFSKSRA
jgi:O-antigen/teichoic acid export membrane protein